MKTINYTSKLSKVFPRSASRLKTFLVLIAVVSLAIISSVAHTQTIPSSCVPPDSLSDAYRIDATQIAVRKFFDKNLPEKDSIDVPLTHRDSILDALVAVYNIDTPERDTVIDLLNIHILYQDMGDVYAKIDTTYFTINEPSLDSLINKYNLTVYYNNNPTLVFFGVEPKYNQRALINALEDVSGIHYAGGEYLEMDGNNIEAEIHDNHVELLYSHAWDLCPFACQYRRFWKFKVYYDCSVEFVESYGDKYFPPDELSVNDEGVLEILSIYPNPATTQLNFTLANASNFLKLEIYDLTGKTVKSKEYINQGNDEFNGSIDVSELKKDLYFCKFNIGNQQITRRFIKQ